MLKIGITFDPPEEPIKMFSNGIRQNALYLMELLINCGYDSYLIIAPGKEDKVEGLYGFDGKYKWTKYEDILNSKFDILIQLVFQVPSNTLLEMKKNGTKLISYNCGNEYVVILESVLFNDKIDFKHNDIDLKIFDEVWSIPQHKNTNFHYWKTLLRTDVKIVDPIWSPLAIEQLEVDNISKGKGDFKYRLRETSKKIGIFEPNLSVVKWFFPALLVCENAYRIDSENLKYVYVTNALDKKDKFNINFVNNIVKSLDIYKDGKMSIEARYNTLYFMSNYSDIAVSHQWENPLNYLYLDLAWMGWPIVHNAHLCKDVGYYYEGFNYKQGGEVLLDVINNHDKNSDEYLKRNRKVIDRYLPTNKKLQKHYKKLIENIMKTK